MNFITVSSNKLEAVFCISGKLIYKKKSTVYWQESQIGSFAFAEILKSLTRTEDVIARYGGEEFIALINYEKEEVLGYIKRVKKAITSTNFIYKEETIHIKFSAGISYRNKYDSYSDAKKRADELLYEAKSKGRDKIIFDNESEI